MTQGDDMTLAVAGISHRRTTLALREQLAFSAEQLPGQLRKLSNAFSGVEIVLLSTCNRTELYMFSYQPDLEPRELLNALARQRDVDLSPMADDVYCYQGPATVRHLFRVSAGLDSMILGEAQILGQVKQAYLGASQAETTGKVLNALFQESFRVGKAVRSETRIGEGKTSVGSVAVAFAQKIFSNLAGKRVLVLGAGETAEMVVEHLFSAGLEDLLVANRSPERAAALVQRYGGEWLPLDALGKHLHRPDIIIGSTAAPRPILHEQQMRDALNRRGEQPVFILDLAVPRDVDARIGDFDNVFLYNIDDLQSVVAENLGQRETQVARAQELIELRCKDFDLFLSGLDLAPLIAELHQRGESIRGQALEQLFARETFDPEQRARIEATARQIVNQLLHDPVDEIKEVLRDGNRYFAFNFFRRIFRLGQKTPAQSSDKA